MKFAEQGMLFQENRKKYLLTVFLLVLAITLFVYGQTAGARRKNLDYAASLEMTVVIVNGQEMTLRDLAYYVAYEEALVQKQAWVYDPEHPSKYWNVHIDGNFVRTSAKKTAVQMAIHDEIFAQMAEKDNIILTAEERSDADRAGMFFWEDLVEDEKAERLGIKECDMISMFERMALSQKYQSIYEQLQGKKSGAYNLEEDAYQKLLKQQSFEICESVWKRIHFGNVTLSNENK